MTANTTFNIDASPKNDFKEIFVGDNKMFVNKDKLISRVDEEVMCISKNKSDCNVLDIYTRLLNLTVHGENLYKEFVRAKGHVRSVADFQRAYSLKYGVARITFVRAMNELRARGIAVINNRTADLVDIYNIYEATQEAKSIVILL